MAPITTRALRPGSPVLLTTRLPTPDTSPTGNATRNLISTELALMHLLQHGPSASALKPALADTAAAVDTYCWLLTGHQPATPASPRLPHVRPVQRPDEQDRPARPVLQRTQ